MVPVVSIMERIEVPLYYALGHNLAKFKGACTGAAEVTRFEFSMYMLVCLVILGNVELHNL